ncbi:MAG: rhodanese-related sulfurtransferase [Ulvibacter sp.]|jgi:rhodanese-related sulfurtransferase
MKRNMPLSYLLALLLMSCNTSVHKEDAKIININVEKFNARMTEPNVVILDVRTPKEIADGTIAGAMGIDVKGKEFDEKVKALDKTKTYLVYCRSGRRSSKACGIMANKGFEKLYNLKGGYTAWRYLSD